MNKETLRMQFLSGVITESEYKEQLKENLWDRIKNAPKSWLAKIKGGAPAIMVKSLEDAGLKVGKPIYYNHAGFLHKIELKSIDYNTGAVDITYEKSNDGGKSWKIDDAEGLYQKLDLEQDLSKLQNMDEKELQNWYNKTVGNTKKQFQRKDIAYDPKDLAEPTSLNEHYIAGGIVGVGAINNPFADRKKESYEDAFEYFLNKKYNLKEAEEETMVDSNMLSSYIDELINLADDMEYTPEMVQELESLKTKLSDGKMSVENALNIIQQTIDITEDEIDAVEALGQAVDYDDTIISKAREISGLDEGKEVEESNLYHNELARLEPEGRFWIVSWRGMDGPKEKVFTDEDEARAFMNTLEEGKEVEEPNNY